MTEGETLESWLDAAAAELDGVEKSIVDGAPSWAALGVTFAVLTAAGVELRLDPPIADAATRTPDVASSARGPEWVRFEPKTLDDHAVDRLEAWFALARRRATGAGRTT